MGRPNSWGSKSNRARRKAVANENAKAEQVDCADCGGRHRTGRHYR